MSGSSTYSLTLKIHALTLDTEEPLLLKIEGFAGFGIRERCDEEHSVDADVDVEDSR
jgi:hypothetical protein